MIRDAKALTAESLAKRTSPTPLRMTTKRVLWARWRRWRRWRPAAAVSRRKCSMEKQNRSTNPAKTRI